MTRILAAVLLSTLACRTATAQSSDRPRIRDLGISPGVLTPGPLNAITDVAGVRVGHRTLERGDDVRTGVTVVIPHGGDLFQEKVPAAVYVANAFGKAAGLLQVEELGTLETPIVLMNTLNVGTAVEAVVAWTLRQPGNENVRSVNAVVGETNDGYLNDIRGQHVRAEDVWQAIESAADGPVAEGSVGAGTGTMCYGWKGGIGTSSRVLPDSLGGYAVGVLVQSNFGGILTIDGHRAGEALGRYAFKTAIESGRKPARTPPDEGSVMVVIATDAPVSVRNLKRMAKRAPLGLARTGSFISNGSGDFIIAFSNARTTPYTPTERVTDEAVLHNDFMSPLFLAVVEGVEEAVYNSLTRASTVNGRDGHIGEAIPIDELRDLLKR